MTVRNLELSLRPRSVAVIGASVRERSVGRVVLDNVISGGFAGEIYPVNPKYKEVAGLRCYQRVSDLPAAPDVALIATPPTTVPSLIAELGARGTRVAVVITAGIGDQDGLRQRMLDAARPYLLRIIGPNTIGLLSPRVALNASFTESAPAMGHLGLISQSGAMVSSMVDWAAAEGIGFSQIFSLGDMADVDVGDALNMLAVDDKTTAILMYLESIPAARKFMSAARAAARIKPVIAIKPGRHEAAARAARTHTGALAGADRVVDAALRRAGIIRVDDLEGLFEAAAVTSRFAPMQSGRVVIVTNGGGAGVLAVDALADRGSTLAELSPQTIAALDRGLPSIWSHANPIDIIGDAPPERYRLAVETAAAEPNVDALLVMNCPTALASPLEAAAAVGALLENGRIGGKPVLTCWLGKKAAEPARQGLQRAGAANFDTPGKAAEAVSLLTRWSSLRRAIEHVPPSTGETPADGAAVRAILAAVAAEGRSVLTEPEAKGVIAAYGITVPELIIARSDEEVAAAAARLLARYDAVVVKLLSRAVSHKSDVGGVVVDLRSSTAAAAAAAAIRRRLALASPGSPVEGFAVQPMVRRPAPELIIGIGSDPIFGPTLLFGSGGTSVEVMDDVAIGLVPIDDALADDLINRTRVSRLLAGFRDHKPADRGEIVKALRALSQLAVDFPAIVSIDVNPLLADADGIIALDARVEIDPRRISEAGPNASLAVRPYPSGWEKTIDLGSNRILLRPIRPADAALYPDFLGGVTAEDMRLRFLTPLKSISPQMLVRLTQLDYDRDIAFVALDEASGALCGIVRYAADPDHETAEFGVLVRSDLQGLGLGAQLMRHLIDYAKAERVTRLEGLILLENGRMQRLCRELGFTVSVTDVEPGLMTASLDLGEGKSTAAM